MVESDTDHEDLCSQLQILAALREAHEQEAAPGGSSMGPTSRAASVPKAHRDRHTKRKHADTLDDRDRAALDSPGAGAQSPKVMIGARERFLAKSSTRAGSVPAGRESSVKTEEGGEASDSVKRESFSMA